MRLRAIDTEIGARQDDLLTTGEAARILGTSRQHVVDLCNRGELPFVSAGTHRRIRRADVAALQARTQRLTRDQERSLWLGHATAGKLVSDPDVAIGKARDNLSRLRSTHPRGASRRWLDEWDRLLQGPIGPILETLTSRTPRARELRQNSPFAGVLTEAERAAVLAAFTATHARTRP
jgi:excisionase family DNA binding protein